MRKLEQGELFSTPSGFTLPNYDAQNLSNLQSAEKLATYFSSISQEFSPINIEDSSPKVKMLLKDAEKQKKPVLEPNEVYHRINRSKNQNQLFKVIYLSS